MRKYYFKYIYSVNRGEQICQPCFKGRPKAPEKGFSRVYPAFTPTLTPLKRAGLEAWHIMAVWPG